MIEIDVNEKILRVVRRHWFILVGHLLTLVLAVALPVLFLAVAAYLDLGERLHLVGSSFAAGLFFLFAWFLVVWIIGWNIWTDYYLDVLIVTDRRVFDIEQMGLFRRSSSSFRIDRIQNVTVDVKGIIQTFLDFGTLIIETAGERQEFTATYIARPYEIKKFLNDCHDEAMERSQLVHLSPDEEKRLDEALGAGAKQHRYNP